MGERRGPNLPEAPRAGCSSKPGSSSAPRPVAEHPPPVSAHICAHQSLWLQTTLFVFTISLLPLSPAEAWDRCCPGVRRGGTSRQCRGAKPLIPSGHAQPMLCDRLLLSEERARTRLPQPSSLGGSPGAGGWLPTSGRISPWGASRQLLLQGIITHTVTLTQKPCLGRQVSQCSLLPALQQSWGLEIAQGTDTRTFWVRNRMVFPPSN